MSNNKKKKGKKGTSGGFGKKVAVLGLLVAVGGATVWLLMPEQFHSQVDALKNMLGL